MFALAMTEMVIGQEHQFLKIANSKPEPTSSPGFTGGTAIHPETPSTKEKRDGESHRLLPASLSLHSPSLLSTTVTPAWKHPGYFTPTAALAPLKTWWRRGAGHDHCPCAPACPSCWQPLLKPSPYFPSLERGGRNSMVC